MAQDELVQQQLEDRIAALPPVVQDAIASADVEAQLRELSKTHKLHLDQWDLLENEVMMTLLGLESPENLATNIENEVKVNRDSAIALAADISRIIFAPIRVELESALSNNPRDIDVSIPPPSLVSAPYTPDPSIVSPSYDSQSVVHKPTPLISLPASLPESADTKVVRGDAHLDYTTNLSHERKTIAGDPYREQA